MEVRCASGREAVATRLMKSSCGQSFPGAAVDEEPSPYRIVKARFIASLGMAWLRNVFLRLASLNHLTDFP
jgi:hypothetical protein